MQLFPCTAEIAFPCCEGSAKIPHCADSCFPRTADFWQLIFFPRTVGDPNYSMIFSLPIGRHQRHLLTTKQGIYWGYRIRNTEIAKNS